MKTRSFCLYGIICCLALLLTAPLYPFIAGADDTAAGSVIRLNKIHIGKLNQEIQNHLNKIRQDSKRELTLLGELKLIDEKLAARKKKLVAFKQEMAEQKKLIAEKNRELSRVKQVSDRIQQHLEQRLRSFYLMGTTGFLNVSFGRKNLPDLMLFNDAFKQMLAYDQSIITSYRGTIKELTRAKRALELEKSILSGLIHQTEKEKLALADIRQKKRQLLTRIKSKKGLYEQAVREMQKAEHDLTKSLTVLRRKKRNRQRGFLLNKGRMQGPVAGELVVRFGEIVNDAPCKGIIIHTDENAPVQSIYTGKVLFAGYKLGYGNMVIIDHGLGYYTVTAHLDDIFVREGNRVLGGQQIGTTGDIATLFSKGLYFEIRKGSRPVDPLQWLSANAYPQLIPLPVPKIDEKSKQPIFRERRILPHRQQQPAKEKNENEK